MFFAVAAAVAFAAGVFVGSRAGHGDRDLARAIAALEAQQASLTHLVANSSCLTTASQAAATPTLAPPSTIDTRSAAAMAARPQEAPPDPPSNDSAAVLAEAQTVLEDALARGRWTEADAVAMHQRVFELPAAERDELIRRLMVAINSGQLEVTTAGPAL